MRGMGITLKTCIFSFALVIIAVHSQEAFAAKKKTKPGEVLIVGSKRSVKAHRHANHKDLTVSIYLVKSARRAPRVPLMVRSGQALYVQVSARGKNGILVRRIGWKAKRTGIPGLDSMHHANSGDRSADAHTWSAGSIRRAGRYQFCGVAKGTRGERARRCIWVTVKKGGSFHQTLRTGALTMTGLRFNPQTLRTSTLTMTGVRFKPQVLTTGILTMTGLRFKPQTLRTGTLRMTGMRK